MGSKALAAVATIATPETILRSYRELVAKKNDGSQRSETPGDRMHMKYNDGRLANRLAPGLARLSSPCGRNAPPARLSCR